jgi:hypothetical protein
MITGRPRSSRLVVSRSSCLSGTLIAPGRCSSSYGGRQHLDDLRLLVGEQPLHLLAVDRRWHQHCRSTRRRRRVRRRLPPRSRSRSPAPADARRASAPHSRGRRRSAAPGGTGSTPTGDRARPRPRPPTAAPTPRPRRERPARRSRGRSRGRASHLDWLLEHGRDPVGLPVRGLAFFAEPEVDLQGARTSAAVSCG